MEQTTSAKKEKRKVDSNEFLALFAKHSKINNLQIVDSIDFGTTASFASKRIEIINCDFDDEVILNLKTRLKNLYFANCNFKKRLLLFNSKLGSVGIKKCIIQQYIATKELFADTFEIEGCVFNNVRELKLHEFSANQFVFSKNEAENDIYIKPVSVKKVIIEGGEKNYLITFSNLENKETIKEFLFFTYSHYRSDYLLRNFSCEELKIFGELKDSRLSLNNIKVSTGLINYFSNQGIFKISTLNPLHAQSHIIIKNSTLGKAELNNCDFSLFKKVFVSSSSLLEIIPVNITWCNSRNIASYDDSSQRENFRQIKVVASKNEDVHTKLIFEKHEMQSLLNQLRKADGSVIDKFILQTNYYSNDFGLNWMKAFCWLIGTSIVWYTCAKYSLGHTVFDTKLIWDEIGKFLLFVNPIHQFDKIFGIDYSQQNTNGAVFFDALSRIIGAYLIYQFISAFRKYSKK